MINNYNSIPKELNQDYQLHLTSEKIRSTRVMCSLSLLLYFAFLVVDHYALPSALYEAFLIRIVVIFSLAIAFISSYSKYFIKYYQLIHIIPFLLAGIGINLMIYISEHGDKASDIYFAGLILVIMVLFSWSHLRLLSVLATTTLLIGMYIGIEISKNNEFLATLPIIISNCFFLISAAIIGFVTQVMRDQYLRQNFLLQHSLKDSLKLKSEEASENEYLANHDPLTDLPNRRYMMELLHISLETACEKDKVLVIMFVDLNGFKQVNDVYGHNAGDEVLLIVAKRLELAIRRGDQLSRLGGDEYLLGLMMEKDNLGEVDTMANKFVDLISQPMNVEGLRIKIGASVGVAAYPIHGNNIEALIQIADQRMYEAKKRKLRNRKRLDSVANYENSVVIFPGNLK